MFLANVRTPVEREGDLAAQIGACRVGERRIKEVVAKYGVAKVNGLVEDLLTYSERLMRAELRKMPAGVFEAEDYLDGDGVTDDPIRIAVDDQIRSSGGFGGDRLRWIVAAGEGKRECRLSDYLLRLLLHAALFAWRRCAGNGRIDELGDGIRTEGNDCERPTARACGRWECGDEPAHRGYVAARVGTGRAGSRALRQAMGR